MTSEPDILDDLFHGCSFAAFITVARETGGWPESEAVKARAYALYEEELKEKKATDRERTSMTISPANPQTAVAD